MPFISQNTLTKTLYERTKATPNSIAFQYKDQNKNCISKSFKNFYEECRLLSYGLIHMGIKQNDKIAILSNTRYEWTLCDWAILGAKGISVPIYATSSPQDVAYLLDHSETQILFIETEEQLQKVPQIKDCLPKLKKIILFEPLNKNTHASNKVLNLQQVIEFGKIEETKDPALFEKNLLSIKPNDLVTICYTSGTTGIPKGAMLTHQNFQAMLDNCVKNFSKHLKPEAETDLLYLPFSHIIGRAEAFATHVFGWKGCFAENLEALPQALVEIRPTVLFSVPRIFEKSWQKISDRIEHSTKLQKKIFYSALESGKKYLQNQASFTEKMNYFFCKRVFFQKIIKNFGGNLKVVLCGGAPLSAEIANVFQVLGLTILEGYGLTETCGPVTLNSLEKNKIGSVGKPLHDVSLKTTQDGEILVQSKSVFSGYYKMPTETTETLKEGWFYTGDIGFIDNDGFLHVTDRKKDIIVTSGGKNIAPQKIENLLKAKTFICHFIVHGDNRNYLTALVTLNRDIITKYAIDNKILFSDYTELIKNPKIHTAIQKEVDEVNTVLASFERIKKFTLLPRDFSIANGELTPSLKIKRRAIEKRYKAELDRMYETLDSNIK